MKNVTTITITYLNGLNKQIKSNNLTRQKKAFKSLTAIDQATLNNGGLEMKLNYYIGKHHYLNYKRTGNPKAIFKALESYKAVFRTARNYRIIPQCPKFYFKYAETMHIVSNYTECLFKQNELHNTAYKIALHSSKRFPTSTSLKWLVIATHLLGDFSIEEIALFLGHRNIDSSQIYTHIKYTKQIDY